MKKRNWLVWVLVGLPSLALAASAFGKLSGAQSVVESMTKTGLGNSVTVLGALELLIVVLFVYPVTRNVGFFLVCSYLGGAMATHATHGESALAPAVLLGLAWIAMVYQKPYLFWGDAPARRD